MKKLLHGTLPTLAMLCTVGTSVIQVRTWMISSLCESIVDIPAQQENKSSHCKKHPKKCDYNVRRKKLKNNKNKSEKFLSKFNLESYMSDENWLKSN